MSTNRFKNPEEWPELARLWNAHCGSLPKISRMNLDRERRIKKRLLEEDSLEVWLEVIKRLVSSDFCNGFNDRGWKADFDFLLREATLTRTLEGKYDDKLVSSGGGANWDKVWSQVARKDEEIC